MEPAHTVNLTLSRRGAQRPLDYIGNLVVVDGSRLAGTSLVEQTIAAIP
jgi:hypothetical protein